MSCVRLEPVLMFCLFFWTLNAMMVMRNVIDDMVAYVNRHQWFKVVVLSYFFAGYLLSIYLGFDALAAFARRFFA